LAGAVEAMQPLMNMITFTARSRVKIVTLHQNIADAIEANDPAGADEALKQLQTYSIELANDVIAKRSQSA